MSVVQNECDGRTNCFFNVNDGVFLPSNSSCLKNTILLVRYRCKSNIPAAPNILYIKVRSQHELLVVWSFNNNNGDRTKFQICWNKTAGGTDRDCHQGFYFKPTVISTTIPGLQSATKYTITVVRYTSDGATPSRKGQKVAITRSAPLQLQVRGIRSATSFQVKLGALQSADDMYVQIIVSKLRNNTKPTEHPGNDLIPYNENTVDNQPYIAAQIDGTNINQNSVFTVGDDKEYAPSGTRKRKRRSTNYQNVQLEPETYYSVFQRTFKSADLYYDSDWMDVIKTDELPTKASSTPLTNVSVVTTEGTAITQPGGGPDDEKQSGGCSEGRSAGTEDGEKYLVGIIVLIILVIILLVALAYFIYQIRRLKSSKANLENKCKDRNNSKEIDENLDNDDANYDHANYEEVENEESTYTALKRPGPGEEENDVHLYAHLNEVHKDYVNQAETGF
ncbi:Receptor-type tyrosine- phosphatase delta [Paramuricea clavata]|uniref:Receptor-type tyrosine- phosphatase delta n=1 Tax=Paramuricea clavata TaxID=317549 RepID=A0A6S7JCK8_PARCT|nr:Receptor-type tyrosine- phosphatase delta [Paramuricea clavata]